MSMMDRLAHLQRAWDRALREIRNCLRGSAAVVAVALAAQLLIPAIRVAHEIDHARAHKAVLAAGVEAPRASCGHAGHSCRPTSPDNDQNDPRQRPKPPSDEGSCGLCVVLAIVRTAVVPLGPDVVALASIPVGIIRPAADRALVRASSRPPPARGPPVNA